MKDPLSYLVHRLLKINNIHVDSTELQFQIQSHPTYPSLNAITGVLDHFNIENLVIDVPANIKVVGQLPNIFLAQVQENNQKQFVIVVKKDETLKLIYNQKKSSITNVSEFIELFTGIILAVDKKESKSINSLNKSNITLKHIFTILGVLALILTLAQYTTSIADGLFLLISIAGIYIAISIYRQESGETSFLGNAFCSHITEKRNCDAILTSKGAVIYKDFKLSDISLIYFSGLSLLILILIISSYSLFIPKLISLFSIPIIIYSIYYQIYKVKKWCFLCLCIVSILCAQSTISIIDFNPSFQLTTMTITLFAFSGIITFWLFQSELLKSNKTLKSIKIEHFKFKRNFELFHSQLNSVEVISTSIPATSEITYGNTESSFNVTVVTNPLCGHCKSVHQLIEQILNRYSNDVKITIRFNTNLKNIENKATQIALRLTELYNENYDTCLEAMHDIYGDYSVDQWFKKWNTCKDQKTYIKTLQSHGDWCKTHAINFTPDLLVNGKSYPKMFDRKDLIYFVEDLVELSQIKIPSTASAII